MRPKSRSTSAARRSTSADDRDVGRERTAAAAGRGADRSDAASSHGASDRPVMAMSAPASRKRRRHRPSQATRAAGDQRDLAVESNDRALISEPLRILRTRFQLPCQLQPRTSDTNSLASRYETAARHCYDRCRRLDGPLDRRVRIEEQPADRRR